MAGKKNNKFIAILALFLLVFAIAESGGIFSVIGNMPFHIKDVNSFTCPSTYWNQPVGTCNVRLTINDPALVAQSLKGGTGSSEIDVMAAAGGLLQRQDLSEVKADRWDSEWFIIDTDNTVRLVDMKGRTWNGDGEVIVEYLSKEQSCTPKWITQSWGECTTNNQQFRSVFDTNNCGVNSGKPATVQSCTYSQPSSGGSGSSGGTTNLCATTPNKDLGDNGLCLNGNWYPKPSPPPCTPSWKATSAWSDCANSVQTRTLTEYCTGQAKTEQQACTVEPPADDGSGSGNGGGCAPNTNWNVISSGDCVLGINIVKSSDSCGNTKEEFASCESDGNSSFLSKYMYYIAGGILLFFVAIAWILRRKK